MPAAEVQASAVLRELVRDYRVRARGGHGDVLSVKNLRLEVIRVKMGTDKHGYPFGDQRGASHCLLEFLEDLVNYLGGLGGEREALMRHLFAAEYIAVWTCPQCGRSGHRLRQHMSVLHLEKDPSVHCSGAGRLGQVATTADDWCEHCDNKVPYEWDLVGLPPRVLVLGVAAGHNMQSDVLSEDALAAAATAFPRELGLRRHGFLSLASAPANVDLTYELVAMVCHKGYHEVALVRHGQWLGGRTGQ
ncbi:hypothetical protein WJX81_005575 [Elliptochloris bilobata]|uniref:USP domain-containing protein n=1 Tax=Elliptochloris bilobata TaxID=381761 RepID=A0AAW1QV44_9CHLO